VSQFSFQQTTITKQVNLCGNGSDFYSGNTRLNLVQGTSYFLRLSSIPPGERRNSNLEIGHDYPASILPYIIMQQ